MPVRATTQEEHQSTSLCSVLLSERTYGLTETQNGLQTKLTLTLRPLIVVKEPAADRVWTKLDLKMAAFLPHTLRDGRAMAPEAFAGVVQPPARVAVPPAAHRLRGVRASAAPVADQAQRSSNGIADAQNATLSIPNQEGLRGLAVAGTAGLQTVSSRVNLESSTWFSVEVSCDVPFEIWLTSPD